jgi:ribosome-associated protein
MAYARAMPLPAQLKKLLQDCDVETFRGPGPGGQHRNKTESAVRMTHRPTGIVRIARDDRSQLRNRRIALERIWRALEARKRKPRPRLPTGPTKASQERRLASKEIHAAAKRSRHKPTAED